MSAEQPKKRGRPFKVQPQEPTIIETTKPVDIQPVVPDEPIEEIPTTVETRPRPKQTIIKMSDDVKLDEYKSMSEQIQKGEVRWCGWGIDGNKGFHYYLKLK